jgi:phosphoribosylamine--glycine ligase
MKILVVGSGGREHALAWKCAASPRVAEVLVAPGNAGTARDPRLRNAPVAADDVEGLLQLAEAEGVELTIIGPEVPLVAGIVDRFHDRGLPCFGPTADAAQLEGSKAFSKAFMERHGIPTAAYESFTELEPALRYIRKQGAPIVIKADGLAAGKGVIVANTLAEAEAAATGMLSAGSFGSAGSRIVIEEFLRGEEASFMVVTDGTNIVPLASSQDHKARDEGDKGPNTGGMGAYSPAPVVTPDVQQRILQQVIGPTLEGLRAQGINYTGFLYAGLMISPAGMPSVIEFNCRLGDPETQPIMARLVSDLVELCEASIEGRLQDIVVEWDPRAALGVVMAAGGYPDSYDKGQVISGLQDDVSDDARVFHAGTALDADAVVTSGGRVLCVVGLGDTVSDAADSAYRQVNRIGWQDAYFRNDIGHRAIAREKRDAMRGES